MHQTIYYNASNLFKTPLHVSYYYVARKNRYTSLPFYLHFTGFLSHREYILKFWLWSSKFCTIKHLHTLPISSLFNTLTKPPDPPLNFFSLNPDTNRSSMGSGPFLSQHHVSGMLHRLSSETHHHWTLLNQDLKRTFL